MKARVLHGLELEARELEHHPCVRTDVGEAVEHGVADVSSDDNTEAAGFEHFASQSGRCCLAVGARDTNDDSRVELEKLFDLAGDRNPTCACLV